mmetsp:Transcript_67942/g.183510  ORF Transcript_67942/g.183510 Transcript_67942/m.183510 type:complete len:213 (-) Transcript_67942:307-945(-)
MGSRCALRVCTARRGPHQEEPRGAGRHVLLLAKYAWSWTLRGGWRLPHEVPEEAPTGTRGCQPGGGHGGRGRWRVYDVEDLGPRREPRADVLAAVRSAGVRLDRSPRPRQPRGCVLPQAARAAQGLGASLTEGCRCAGGRRGTRRPRGPRGGVAAGRAQAPRRAVFAVGSLRPSCAERGCWELAGALPRRHGLPDVGPRLLPAGARLAAGQP